MTYSVRKEGKECPWSGSKGKVLFTVGFDLLQYLDDLKYKQNDSQPSGKRGHIWLLMKQGRPVRAGIPTLTLVSGGQEQSTTYGLASLAIQLPNPDPIRERLRQIRTLPRIRARAAPASRGD